MRWKLAAAAAVLAWCVLVLPPEHVYACSVGADFNPTRESDVIVAGRVTGWTRADDARIDADPASPFVPIRVAITVDHVLKGAAAATIVAIDRASLTLPPAGAAGEEWRGDAGACGSFDGDPAGKYVLVGLRREGDGQYVASRPLAFFIGESPDEPRYAQAISRLASFGPVRLPITGIGGARAPEDLSLPFIATALMLISGLALTGGAVLRYRNRQRV